MHSLWSFLNRHDVEEKWNERAEGHKSETEALTKQIMEAEGLLEQLRMSYATMYEATRKDLKSLTADREHSHKTSARGKRGCPRRQM